MTTRHTLLIGASSPLPESILHLLETWPDAHPPEHVCIFLKFLQSPGSSATVFWNPDDGILNAIFGLRIPIYLRLFHETDFLTINNESVTLLNSDVIFVEFEISCLKLLSKILWTIFKCNFLFAQGLNLLIVHPWSVLQLWRFLKILTNF